MIFPTKLDFAFEIQAPRIVPKIFPFVVALDVQFENEFENITIMFILRA